MLDMDTPLCDACMCAQDLDAPSGVATETLFFDDGESLVDCAVDDGVCLRVEYRLETSVEDKQIVVNARVLQVC